MYNPKAIRKEKDKRHFKRVIRREKDALLPWKRLQFSYGRHMNRQVKGMFPEYMTLHF